MLKFSITKPVAEANRATVLDIIEATEGLNNAWMDLTEAQRNLDEVCQVMENIQQSLDLVAQFGKDAIAPLNLDKGLESLICIPEKLITADKAQEGLGDAAKAAWEKFKEWCKKIWDTVKKVIASIYNWITSLFGRHESVIERIEKKTSRKSTESLESVNDKRIVVDPDSLSHLLEFYQMINQPIIDLHDCLTVNYDVIHKYSDLFFNAKSIKSDKYIEVLNECIDSTREIYPGIVRTIEQFTKRFCNGCSLQSYDLSRLASSIGIDNPTEMETLPISPSDMLSSSIVRSDFNKWSHVYANSLKDKAKRYLMTTKSLKAFRDMEGKHDVEGPIPSDAECDELIEHEVNVLPNKTGSKVRSVIHQYSQQFMYSFKLLATLYQIKMNIMTLVLKNIEQYYDYDWVD